MKPTGMPTWHDFPLRRELTAITELPVDIETAGRGLALAELWQGEASLLPPAEQPSRVVFGKRKGPVATCTPDELFVL